jgi:hypothetical protein
MAYDKKTVGSSTILMFGAAHDAGVHHAPANDNEKEKTIKTVTLRKKLDKSGVVIKVKVPVEEYYGVVVITDISEEGVLSSAIELVHEDKSLNYRVFFEEGNINVVAEWQNWGKKLRLPLFIQAGDKGLMPYSQQVGGLMLGNSNERKKAIGESNRRPRFLNRRK